MVLNTDPIRLSVVLHAPPQFEGLENVVYNVINAEFALFYWDYMFHWFAFSGILAKTATEEDKNNRRFTQKWLWSWWLNF